MPPSPAPVATAPNTPTPPTERPPAAAQANAAGPTELTGKPAYAERLDKARQLIPAIGRGLYRRELFRVTP